MNHTFDFQKYRHIIYFWWNNCIFPSVNVILLISVNVILLISCFSLFFKNLIKVFFKNFKENFKDLGTHLIMKFCSIKLVLFYKRKLLKVILKIESSTKFESVPEAWIIPLQYILG